jgi:hypothetical protein
MAGAPLILPFLPLGFQRSEISFPFHINFVGHETLDLNVATGATAKTLHLKFTPTTIDVMQEADMDNARHALQGYFDGS